MKRKPRKGSCLLRFAGILAVALAVFLTALWLLLPYKDFERRIEAELSKFGIEAKVAGLGPVTPLSYEIKNIVLESAYGRELGLTLVETRIELSLSSLFSGKLGTAVSTKVFGGTLRAETEVPAPNELKFSWRGLDLAPVADLFWENGYPVKGRSDGSGRMALPYTTLATADMNVEADLSGVAVGPIRVVALAFDPISLGSGRLKAEIANGKMKIAETKLAGGDLGLAVSGVVTLASPMARSALDASVEIVPSEKAARELFIPLSLIAPYKTPEGSYSIKLRGPIASPAASTR